MTQNGSVRSPYILVDHTSVGTATGIMCRLFQSSVTGNVISG